MPTLAEMMGQMILVGFHGTAVESTLSHLNLTDLSSFSLPPTLSSFAVGSVCSGASSEPNAIPTTDFSIIPGTSQLRWTTVLSEQIRLGHVGGVILYGYNIESPEQTASLVSGLRRASGSGLPPLEVSIDVEGGRVNRLTEQKGFGPNFKPALELAQSSEDEVRSNYAGMARSLHQLGFTLNYAPLVDLHDPSAKVIGGLQRAYSTDPAEVARLASIAIEEHHKQGLLTCIKHFPGHGLAREDSHEGMVDITESADPKRELRPYELLAKKNKIDMVMTAHVFNRDSDWDPHYPATLSPSINRDHLRGGTIKYDGVVISDDLHMGAIQEFCQHEMEANKSFASILEASVILAINADVDMLMFSNNPSSAKNIKDFSPDPFIPERVIDIVTRAIADGRLQRTQIEAAYGRVMKLKQRLRTQT